MPFPKGAKNFGNRPKHEHLAIAAKGGRAKSLAKRVANIRKQSKIAKCKNCKLVCEFKERLMNRNPDSVCVVPHLRADAIINNFTGIEVGEDFIKGATMQVLKRLFEYYEENPDKLTGRTLHWFLEVKKAYFPATNKNINTNINIDFKDMYKQWEEDRKEWLKKNNFIKDADVEVEEVKVEEVKENAEE